MSGYFASAPPSSRLHHRAPGVIRPFEHRRLRPGHQTATALGRVRVEIGHRLAPVEFFPDRSKHRIARPFAAVTGHQSNSVGLQRVERVLDLLQRPINVGQRHRREQAEPAGMVAAHLRRVVVAQPRQIASLRRVLEMRAPRRHRGNPGGDPGLVHVLDHPGGAPPGHQRARLVADNLGHLVEIAGWEEMVVDVDAPRSRIEGIGRASSRQRPCRGQPREQRPP